VPVVTSISTPVIDH